MNYMSQLKKKLNYETNVPRCETCVSYRRQKYLLTTDSIPVKRIVPICFKHGFTVAENSVCDSWNDKSGATL